MEHSQAGNLTSCQYQHGPRKHDYTIVGADKTALQFHWKPLHLLLKIQKNEFQQNQSNLKYGKPNGFTCLPLNFSAYQSVFYSKARFA